MKLKELEALMTSIAKHDKILHETQANIINMRREIDVVKALTNSRKRSCTSVIEHGLNQRVSKDKQKPFGIV